MYFDYFGLDQAPFKITPDTRLFYAGSNRGAILQALSYTVLNGEGIVKVVGEVGSGKTMLCRMLEEQLPEHVEVVYLDNPSLSPDNILHAIAIEMNLPVHMHDNHFEVMKKLQHYLLDKHTQNKQVVVFVEEAQGMPIETLEEIRLLSNLETQHHKLLQIVLFGQPELDNNLSQQRIRQLRDRITHRFCLEPLNKHDVKDYLMARMRVSGFRGADPFSNSAVSLITRASKGLMRRINILADKSLLAAYADSCKEITRAHVVKAIKDSDFSGRDGYRHWGFAAASLVLLMFVLLVYLFEFNEKMAIPGNSQQSQLSGLEKTQSQPEKSAPAARNDTDKPNKNNSLIATRFDRTRDWLAAANSRHYSIQVMQTRADFKKDIERFLLKQSVEGDIEKLFLYQTRINGRLMYCVLYDEFESYDDALKALELMPPDLKRNKPFLRSIYQLKEEAMDVDIS